MSVYLFPTHRINFGSDPATSCQEVTVSHNFSPNVLHISSGGVSSIVQATPCPPPTQGQDVCETICGCMHQSRFHFTGDRQEDVSLIIGNRINIIPIVQHRSCHYIGCTCPAWETDNVQWLHNRKYLSQVPDTDNRRNGDKAEVRLG